MKKKHMVMLAKRKARDKIQSLFTLRAQQTKNRGEFTQPEKEHLQKSYNWGAWVAQLIKHPTLGLSSSIYLRVMRSNPMLGSTWAHGAYFKKLFSCSTKDPQVQRRSGAGWKVVRILLEPLDGALLFSFNSHTAC